jgi:uncharacterized protein with FMN-binding domain/predicted Rdx family selenoprotein
MKTICLLIFLAAAAMGRADTIELANGAKLEGRVLENNAVLRTLTIEFNVGGTLTKRVVPYASVKAVIPKGGAALPAAPVAKTPADVRALIAKVGPTDPDWLLATQSNHPTTLDLSWPEKPPGGWNNQKNVGQFIWDVINPNSTRWREGVKFMDQLLKSKPSADVKARAIKELANMYFRFFQDYARAAFWWQQAGVKVEDGAGIHLAECYWRLGSKQMALDFLKQTQQLDLDAIKLLGDMGETDRALEMAKKYDEHEAWLRAGDACRLAGRIPEAKTFYEKVVNTPPTGPRAERLKRTQARAQESLNALTLYELADVSKVRDGTYKDSCLGYEAQVEVTVTVQNKKIESVKVTQHKEKQYYSSLTDVPAQIIAKQGVKGVDATSRATITGEAIINATAKALGQGAK